MEYFVGALFAALLYVLISLVAIMSEKKPADKISVLKAVYVYTVSFVSLGVFLLGIGTFAYTTIAKTFFPKVVEHQMRWELDNCEEPLYKEAPVRLAEGEDVLELDAEEKSDEEIAQCKADYLEVDFQERILTSLILMLIGLPLYIVHFVYLRRKLS